MLPPAGLIISDAARRAADAMTEARDTGLIGAWVAIRLSDGGTDGKVYEMRADAVKHQLHETQCMYLAVPPLPIPAAEMQVMLDKHREMYDAGFRMIDPQEART